MRGTLAPGEASILPPAPGCSPAHVRAWGATLTGWQGWTRASSSSFRGASEAG